MGLFGFGKKRYVDETLSTQNKKRMRELFNHVVADGDSYQLVYGYSENVKTSNYIVARKTTYEFTSLIIGYRKSDWSIVLVQTTPELEGCSEPKIFTRETIKKAKMAMGFYNIFHQGGLMAGYTQFGCVPVCDEKYLVKVNQEDECQAFDQFFKQFSKK